MSISKTGKEVASLGDSVIEITIVIVLLSKMALTAGIGATAQTALGTAVGAIDDYFDWISLIVLFVVIVYFKNKSKNGVSG